MRSRTTLLAGQTTALGLMSAFLVVPASALFLHTHGARALPWTYLLVAVAGVLTSAGVTRAGLRVPLGRLAASLVLAYAAIVGAAWLALAAWHVEWVTFALVVLFPLSIPVGFVAVGSQAVRLFDVRELKVRFPRVVLGFPVGFAAGGVAAGLLSGALDGVEHLLIVCVASAGVMLWFVVLTAREFPAELSTPHVGPVAGHAGAPAPERRRHGLRHPLVLAVLAYQVLAGAVTQLLDYVVWERAAVAFPTPDSLARFQGLYGAVINIAGILFVGLAASALMQRYGLRLGLVADPATVLVVGTAMVATGIGPGIAGFGFLGVACLAQVVHIATTDGLTRTSVAATYQAVPPAQRLSAQALAEGAGTPVAIGLVGALLLLGQALRLDVLAASSLLVALTAAWLGVALLAHRSYRSHLAEVLRHRAWDPRALRVDGPGERVAVRRLLASDRPSDRITALEALADSRAHDLTDEVAHALSDPEPYVRLHALGLVAREQLGRRPAVSRALAGLMDASPVGVRAASLLVGGTGPEGARALEVWSAAAIGADVSCAEAALAGAAEAPHAAYLPVLLALAGRHEPPLALVPALAGQADLLGEQLRTLWSVSGDSGSEARRRRAVVIRAVMGAGRSQPRDWLLAKLDGRVDRSDLRLVLDGLAPTSWARRPTTVRVGVLTGVLEAEAARVHATLCVLDALDDMAVAGGDGHAVEIARSALRDELDEARRHVESIVGASACPRGTAWLRRALAEPEQQLRATAIELVESALGRRRSAIALAVVDPALDHGSRRSALEVAGSLGADSFADPLARLVEVATDPDRRWDSPWLRASMLRTLVVLSPGHAERAARTLVDDADPVVAQTGAWARALVVAR